MVSVSAALAFRLFAKHFSCHRFLGGRLNKVRVKGQMGQKRAPRKAKKGQKAECWMFCYCSKFTSNLKTVVVKSSQRTPTRFHDKCFSPNWSNIATPFFCWFCCFFSVFAPQNSIKKRNQTKLDLRRGPKQFLSDSRTWLWPIWGWLAKARLSPPQGTLQFILLAIVYFYNISDRVFVWQSAAKSYVCWHPYRSCETSPPTTSPPPVTISPPQILPQTSSPPV